MRHLRWHATPWQYFTDEQMRDIHCAALEILQDPGTLVQHEEAVTLLESAGAYCEGQRVLIPGSLVEWALRQAPSSVMIYNRHRQPAMLLEGRQVYFGTGSDCPYILDYDTGQRRSATCRDVQDGVKLVDFLPQLDFTMSMGLLSDVDPGVAYQHQYAAMIRGTTKPQVVVAGDRASLEDIAAMAAAVVGGVPQLEHKPLFVLYDEPTSPLIHSFQALDKLLCAAHRRIPVSYSPGMMAGGTGPVTIAGAIALANAEILTGLLIHQLKKPGAPFIFGAGMSPLDMRSAQPTYAAPEAMMAQAGLCDIGRRLYRLPTWGFAGCSAAKLADEQAANEAATYILTAALMGSNLNHDVGYIESGLTYSLAMLVMCDEFIGQARRMMAGIAVDREQLALEAIRRVGPGGSFLGDAHTLRHFRENWLPGITDRNMYQEWRDKGGTTMGQRACAKIKHILTQHRCEALPPKVDAQITEILKKAESR